MNSLYSLTTQFSEDGRCDRCDNSLRASNLDGHPVVIQFNTWRGTKTKYLCIRCAGRSKRADIITLENVSKFLHIENVKPSKNNWFRTFRCRTSKHNNCKNFEGRCNCDCHKSIFQNNGEDDLA